MHYYSHHIGDFSRDTSNLGEQRMPRWRRFSPKASTSQSIPDVGGVYVLFFAGRTIYVGMSKNIRYRMRQHNLCNQCGSNIFDGWMETPWGKLPWCDGKVTGKYCEIPDPSEARRLESRLIRRLSPLFNIQGVRRGW